MLCRITALNEISGIAGEKVLNLYYYGNVLPKFNVIGQRRLLFWQKIYYSDNVVLKTLKALKDNTLLQRVLNVILVHTISKI